MLVAILLINTIYRLDLDPHLLLVRLFPIIKFILIEVIDLVLVRWLLSLIRRLRTLNMIIHDLKDHGFQVLLFGGL